MSVVAFKTPETIPPPASPLEVAFERAMRFGPERAHALHIHRATLHRLAEEEASFGRIVVDERGLTAGARLHVLQPARHVLAEWRSLRAAFEAALEPKRTTIDAADRLDADVAALRHGVRDELTEIAQAWRNQERNKVIESDWNDAQLRYAAAKSRNGGRLATMTATTPLYWLALMAIGLADWLINYDTFFAFAGVPAIAAGATFIIALLLALGAHGHGELVKQWSHRMGDATPKGMRMPAIRLAILSTLAAVVVLLAAGGSRYAAAMHAMALQTPPPLTIANILGAEAMVDIDPLRDVLISLLANIGAWIVGVLLSCAAHDVDPDFMAATSQHRRESRRFDRARRGMTTRIAALEEQCSREVMHLTVETLSMAALVVPERGQLAQIVAREEAIVAALVEAATATAGQYRDLLAQHAMARRGDVQIFLMDEAGHRDLSPYDLMAIDMRIDAAFLAATLR
jgi:hypothetical protein